MKSEKLWYIVYTPAGNELKTLYALRKKQIECFCPLVHKAITMGNKRNASPLLPNYLFVHILPQEQAAIRQIDGVVNFMYWLGECVVVSDEAMIVLKELTEKYQVLSAEKIKVDTTGMSSTSVWEYMPVKSSSNMDEEDLVKVSFPAYGFAITAKENKMNVRVINIDKSRSTQKTSSILYNKWAGKNRISLFNWAYNYLGK